MLLRVTACLVMLVAGVVASPAVDDQPAASGASALQRLLTGELARMPARTGIYVKHLTTGEEAAVRGDDRFNSASVIKIPVLVMGYQMADKGTLDLDVRITMNKADKRGGSGVLRYHDAGLQPTLRDVMMQMIITSDNTATDMAIARVGGVARVNEWLKANAYAPALKLNFTILDVFRNRYDLVDPDARTLSADDVYGLGSNDLAYGTSPRPRLEAIATAMRKPEIQAESVRRTNDAPDYWLGEVTPRAVGRLLEAMETGRLTSTKSADDMRRVFRQQQSGSRRLPHYIDVPIGHKTGDFPPAVANDVGVIYTRSGPVVVSLMLNSIREPYGEAEDRMGQVGRTIVEYFDGK